MKLGEILYAVAFASLVASSSAQEVFIPDPGLNAAIREALGKPVGPLSEQDLLSLTELVADHRNIQCIDGLEAARNLTYLDLSLNELTNFALPGELTNLAVLNVGFNPLTNCSLPDGLSSMTALFVEGTLLTNITLPTGLVGLTDLHLSQNQLTSFNLVPGMTNLLGLNLFFNQLTNLTLPADLRSLTQLDLDFNQLAQLNLPPNLTHLSALHLRANQFTNFSVPAELTGLSYLDISKNPLREVTLPSTLSHLAILRLSENRLASFTLPLGLTNLTFLNLSANQLTNIVLPADLTRLESLNLGGNRLGSITLPQGLTSLGGLFVTGNQLTTLTLPADMIKLIGFGILGNPLATLVLSDPLATRNLAGDVAYLKSHGVSVFTYALTVQLIRLRQPLGAFQFAVTGPPGVYAVLSSVDLSEWSPLGVVTNLLGNVVFTDVGAHLMPQKFYRAQGQEPPANMVFIPPNTFTMGSPTNELHREPNEGPQTTVTLTRGFWIGRYEVTQGEYLSVTGTNPSQFPGDLRLPVSSVSWQDATNYCWMLTQQELAAGRIPPGSEYRLPTEAEWECAARAGTSTRFSYGDDPDYASLPNYAWQSLDDGLTVHPVGQKLPNPWGLYDTTGNVFEWCQDWLGPLLGGFVTDPQGPPSNPIGWKIMRGGAFDFGGPACRSASRMFFGNHPALTDWNLGFRVVLVMGSP